VSRELKDYRFVAALDTNWICALLPGLPGDPGAQVNFRWEAGPTYTTHMYLDLTQNWQRLKPKKLLPFLQWASIPGSFSTCSSVLLLICSAGCGSAGHHPVSTPTPRTRDKSAQRACNFTTVMAVSHDKMHQIFFVLLHYMQQWLGWS